MGKVNKTALKRARREAREKASAPRRKRQVIVFAVFLGICIAAGMVLRYVAMAD